VPTCDRDNGARGCRPSHDFRDKEKDKDEDGHGGRDCGDGHGLGHDGFDEHGGKPSNRSVTIRAHTVAATMPSTGGSRIAWFAIVFGGCLAAVAVMTTAVRRRLLAR
jgi:hypothetical protein